MARLGIERVDEQRDPEDHIAILCEVMAGLAAGRFGTEPGADRAFFERHQTLGAPVLRRLRDRPAGAVLQALREPSGACSWRSNRRPSRWMRARVVDKMIGRCAPPIGRNGPGPFIGGRHDEQDRQGDGSPQLPSQSGRRSTAPSAAVSSPIAATEANAYDPGADETKARYRESDHVKAFYRTNGYETLKK